jgi:transcriptional regulator with AAA-type ATPase domain/tetratricopeptide (TPR) repeat protein
MLDAMDPLDGVVGESAPIQRLRETVRDLLRRQSGARRQPPVLILGETGTGKGLLARALHRGGPRAAGPFIDVNCAAIPENLLEAELFGYERGAFTDARQAKPGLFQLATRGTLFLDEIGLLPLALQAKLLTVVEERAVRRLGATRSEAVDVAIVSATNDDIRRAVAGSRFREDLYHRLAVLTLSLPPLRDRGDDVLLLADRFLARACADYGLPPKRFDPHAQLALRGYRWPGNVRELSNVVERVALTGDGPVVSAAMLALPSDRDAEPAASLEMPTADELARRQLVAALEQTAWNISRTAALLRLSRNTVRARIERFGLTAPDARPAPRRDPAPAVAPPVTAEGALFAAALRWERQPVAVMRVAFSASDDRAAGAAGLLEPVIDKITTFGGVVDALTPHSVTATFGLDAVADAPRRAAHASLAVQTHLSRVVADAVTPPPTTWAIAIHAGVVAVGSAVNVRSIDADAREVLHRELVELTAPGECGILVSAPAAALLRRHFELRPADGAPPGAMHLLLPGRAPRAAAESSTFVGRRAELSLLQGLFHAAATGSGVIVSVVGEAGLGKSRLIAAFRESLAGRQVTFLEGRCVPLTAPIPYLPVLDVLRQIVGTSDLDPSPRIADTVPTMLADLGIEEQDAHACIAHLLGAHADGAAQHLLTPDVVKKLTFETVRRVLVALGRRAPVVLSIEDAHWADAASNELFAHVTDALAAAHVLVTVTARPGYSAEWMERAGVTRLALQPLTDDESRALVERLLAGASPEPATLEAIVARGEGNPFFLEELTRVAREAPAASVRAIPETIHQVLLERLGRLDPEARRVVRAAAVVGRDLPVPVLGSVVALADEALRAVVARLRAAQFVVETGIEREAAYTFRHALIHDVCYRSLLDHERRDLHARVVDAFEQEYAGRLGEHAERLAEHALGAHLWDKAAGFLHQAGTKAAALGANAAAAACFERAIDALDRLPPSRETRERGIDARLALRGALLPLGEFARIAESLKSAEGLAEALGDDERLAKVCAYLTDYYRQTGEPARALETGHRAFEAAKRHGHVATEVAARIYLAHAHYDGGTYRAAADLLAGVLALIEGRPVEERYGLPYIVAVHARTWLALCLAELGDFADAVAVAERALEIARAHDHPPSLASALGFLGRVYFRKGEVDRASDILAPCLDLIRRFGMRLFAPMVAEVLGLARVAAGRTHEGLALLEEAAEIHRTMRGTAGLSMRLVSLSLGQHARGRNDLARALAEEALALACKHGERGHEAYALYAAAEATGGSHAAAAELATALGMRPLVALCARENA